MTQAAAGPPRIVPRFRIGVTGHRWLSSGSSEVRDAVAEALTRLAAAAPRLDASRPARVAVVSCLAEGADRIVATAGLDQGLELEVVLPFPPEEYKRDFRTPESADEFDALVSKSSAITVLAPERSRVAGYVEAGRALIARSDVLVALWDGREPHGEGGTASLVAAARRHGIPVVQIRVTHDGGAELDDASAVVQLDYRAGVARELARFDRARCKPAKDLEPTPDAAYTSHVMPYFCKADGLAGRYRDTLRWVSRGLYGLAFAAVAIVSTQLIFFAQASWMAWIEFSVLLVLVVTLASARRQRLLERWTSTRFLAERLRSAIYLSAVGAPPVSVDVRSPHSSDGVAMDWAALALSEICFSAPVNRASDSDPASLRTLLLSGWVRPQIRYQRAVYQRMERNHRLLARVGLGLFLLSLLAAVLHAVDARRDETAPEYWAYVSIVVPALAAAITGYAAQREHLRAAKRADKTARDLERAERDLADVTTHEGLRDVASRIDVMLQGESADWYSLATTHNLELP